ncbi:polysaccharide biosynthesis tyrosine autokinase, partial [candidate division KSB1 bacterium]|nr:polysaccharide biosynthesis tyrosine autokinase [candidate division KSB1 bacterium]
GSQSYLDLLREQLADDEFKQRFAEVYADRHIWSFVASSVSLQQGAYEEMVYLTATAEDSVIAYRIAKAATFAYKERLRQVEQEESYNVVDFVSKQREIARENLESAERELQRFKETTNITLNEEDGGLMRRLIEYENQLAEAETQQALAQANIEAIEQRLSQVKGPEASSGFEIEDPVSRQYKEQIDNIEQQRNQIAQTNPNSPRLDELDRQIERVRNDWIRTIEENMAATSSRPAEGTTREMISEIQSNLLREEMVLYQMKNRVYYYRRLIDNYKRQHPQMLESAIQLTQLQRTKSVYENLYNFLIQRGEEANIKAATSTGGIRIIDEPLMPTQPIPVNAMRLIAMGLILGLGLGFGIAFLQEYLDHSIKNPDDVQKHVGIPVIGTVQSISTPKQRKFALKKSESTNGANGGYKPNLISTISPRDPIADQYRGLRTNLQFSEVDSQLDMLMITSALPGEGKTLTSANLAIIMAEMSKKVVIVDCDLRKPRQHEVFQVDKAPGLTDILAKGDDLNKVIRKTPVPNLYLLTSGTQPPNPAEMVASSRMKDLLQQLRQMFDTVILDTPPVNVVTDPLLLASQVKNVLLVTRFGVSDLKIIQNAKDILNRSRAKIHGVVLNDVKSGRGYGYYYKYNYYYSYYSNADKK